VYFEQRQWTTPDASAAARAERMAEEKARRKRRVSGGAVCGFGVHPIPLALGRRSGNRHTTFLHVMDRWLQWARRIDRFNEWSGRGLYWLTLGMVGVGAFNAIARYLGKYAGVRLSSNMWIELQWYLFSLVFLLGAAYTLKYDDHVRVDVLYGRLSRKGKAWINLLGTALFLLPFCGVVLWMSIPFVANSWAVLEASPDPGGLPRYPIKTVIPLALLLVMLQGVSLMIREVAVLRDVEVEEDAESRPRIG
jgi:TRAP-type mannitol/chloroaromatic compound transport system permease small subunit